MSQFIEEDVKSLRGSTSTNRVKLLVGYENDIDGLEEAIRGIEIESTEQLGRTTLRVIAPESSVEEICRIDGVIAVELDQNDVKLQDATDFHLPTSSMM